MMTPATPFVVGLTGGIGSGKSAAATRFAEHGARVVDTDAIAHELTMSGGEAITELRAAFGDDVIDATGALDRTRMRAMAFSDPQVRKQLESILHPLIRRESVRQCHMGSSPYVVLAVPLLIESGHWRNRCARICVVDCPESQQIARVMARNHIDEAQVRAILSAQTSRANRLAAADDILDNSGDLTALYRQVDALHERYLTLSHA